MNPYRQITGPQQIRPNEQPGTVAGMPSPQHVSVASESLGM